MSLIDRFWLPRSESNQDLSVGDAMALAIIPLLIKLELAIKLPNDE